MRTINAKIIKTFLGREDHGIPTCFVHFVGESTGGAFGGYDLRYWWFCFIDRILQTVGVEKWEDLVGEHIRIKADDQVRIIGNITEDKWFNPKEEKPKNDKEGS